ncbi:hypothetical protein GQ600_10036 [Phytophthora cactorum]|nr:hypothetical protein GQ600_10036 [Phytophthora cactorum]
MGTIPAGRNTYLSRLKVPTPLNGGRVAVNKNMREKDCNKSHNTTAPLQDQGRLTAREILEREQCRIHVLVAFPLKDLKRPREDDDKPQPKLTNLQRLKKSCKKCGVLPQTGDFLKLFEWTDEDCGQLKDISSIENIVVFPGSEFFVRKETLNRQDLHCGLDFLLLAIAKKRPVLWHCFFAGTTYPATTRLLYDGEYFEWTDRNDGTYISLSDILIYFPRYLFCLDGLDQEEIKRRGLPKNHTLLATTDFDVETNLATSVCLLPYWKRDGLEKLAKRLSDPKESDIWSRYYRSGGNLNRFLRAGVRVNLNNMLGYLNTDGTDALQPRYDCENTAIVDNYLRPSCWKPCVTSMRALQHLATMMNPDYFQQLVDIARKLNDSHLEDVALEAHFHALIRHQQSFRFTFGKYALTDLDDKEENGTITCGWTI